MSETSFDPILPQHMHTLILGSAPGKRSLATQQYYAHKGNAFWPLVFSFTKHVYTINYEEKLALLTRKKIGLWDVFDQFVREGSMDHQFQSVTLQPLATLFEEFPLSLVILNGKTATKTYYTNLDSTRSQWLTLSCPSTSGANNRQQQFRQKQWFLAYQISEQINVLAQKGYRLYFGHTPFIWSHVTHLRTEVFIQEQGIQFNDEFDDLHTVDQFDYFLLMDHDTPLATLRFQTKDNQTIQPDRFCVAQGVRNQGIGTILLSLYEHYGKFLGYSSSELVAEYQALEFYQKLGYHAIDAPHSVDNILCQTVIKSFD